MQRFTMFGILPVAFSQDGYWQVDTGNELVSEVAGVAARFVLLLIDRIEENFGVSIPVSLVPVEQLPA